MANKYCSECGTALVDGGCQKCAEPEPDAPAPEKTKGGWGCLVVVLMAAAMLIGLVSCASCFDNASDQYQPQMMNNDGSYMTQEEYKAWRSDVHQDAEDWERVWREWQEQE